MNIGKISSSTTVKALAMGALLCCAIARCNNARSGYINALKNNVRENVDPQDYQYYENKAKQFGVSEEDVFKKAYDSIKSANRNYFEGLQNVRNFE